MNAQELGQCDQTKGRRSTTVIFHNCFNAHIYIFERTAICKGRVNCQWPACEPLIINPMNINAFIDGTL